MEYLLPKFLDRIREHSFGEVLAVEDAISRHILARPASQVLTIVRVHATRCVPVIVAITPRDICVVTIRGNGIFE